MASRYVPLALLLALLASPFASAQILFRAELTGTQEVPPVTTTATGRATAALDGSTLILRGQFEGLESDYNVAIGSHLHRAPEGTNGPVVFALDPALSGDLRSGQWFGPENRFMGLTADQVQALRDGELYVNVHSVDDPGGEVRGQLRPAITLNEIRVDQSGADVDEYVEIAGPAGASLDGFSLVILGDGGGDDRGVIEEVLDLTGQAIPDDGYFLFGQLTLATPDLDVDVNLENGDSVTFLLVEGVAGTEGDDLDADDDGVLDTNPWSRVADAVGSRDDAPEGATYAAQLGFEDVGPNGAFPAAHLFRNRDDGVWRIGAFADLVTYDTPGTANATTSLVQIVHNAPDPDTETVDVYVDGGLAADDLAFRDATPFVLLPAGIPFEIAVAESNSSTAADAFFTTTASLDGAPSYYIVATGIRDDDTFDFGLALYDNARRFSTTPGTVDVGFFHGSPGAGPVDVRDVAVSPAIFFDDVAYGAFAAETYQPFGATSFPVDLTGPSGEYLATFSLDLTGLEDQSALLLASGLPGVPTLQGGDALALLVVRPDGSTSASFPTAGEDGPGADGLALALANPVRESVSVRYAVPEPGPVSLAVFDALGRRVADLAAGPRAAGTHVAAWDARGLAPGVYVLRLGTEAGTLARTVTVVR